MPTSVMQSALLRTVFVRVFVGSVAVNAVLGIWALLSSDFGETQGKVLLTSFLVSAAMLSVLVNTPAMRRRVAWPAPLVGAATGAIGFVLLIGFVWFDPGADAWWKTVGSLLAVAAGATLGANLELLEVPERLGFARLVAAGLITTLVGLVLFGIWANPDDEVYARTLGVNAVLVAAATLVVPVLARFAGRAATPATTVITCTCPECGATFEVQDRGLAPSKYSVKPAGA